VSAQAEAISSYYEAILPYYEAEAADRQDLEFWTRICRRCRPRRALELGAGLGRVTEILAREAEWVTGVDVALPMLARAHGKKISDRLHLTAADMRRLPFAELFDLVAAPSDPMSHLTETEDRAATLRSVAKALTPGGVFVLDGLFLPRGAPFVRRRDIVVPDGTLVVEQSWRPLDRRDRWEARYVYRLRSSRGDRQTRARFMARSWDPDRIAPFFASCGLAVRWIWGSLDERRFTPDARRVIVVAQRRSEPGRNV